MSRTLIIFAAVSGAGAVVGVLLTMSRMLFIYRATNSSGNASVGLTRRLTEGLLCPALAVFGRGLLPLITWNQRRMLSEALVRADLKELDYAQVFALQVLLSALVLSGLWGYVFTNAIEILAHRVELNFLLLFSVCVGSFVWFLPRIWLRRRYQFRLTAIERALPFFLDMVGLGLASGQTLQSALQMACDHLREGSLKAEWNHTLMDIRSGLSRAEALRQLSVRIDLIPLRQLISSLIQGEALGIGMAHIIEVYGKHQRAHRLMAAEKLALQAPIKMLFPLALFIFPCTFLVLGFPVAVQFLGLIP